MELILPFSLTMTAVFGTAAILSAQVSDILVTMGYTCVNWIPKPCRSLETEKFY